MTPYKEPQERNVRAFYKLKVNEDPASKNIPHEEEYDDDNSQIHRRKGNCSVKPTAYNLQIWQKFNINMNEYIILEV